LYCRDIGFTQHVPQEHSVPERDYRQFSGVPKGDLSDDLMKKMNEYGWAVEVTKLPKKVWISYDDRVEFDNEKDYNAFNEEQLRREEQEREEKEKELWEEEYYRRRHDPY
jgi:hypothetical protein